MAEHETATESANDAEPVAGLGSAAEPAAAAVALALGRTGRDRDLNAKAAAYLEEQTRLARCSPSTCMSSGCCRCATWSTRRSIFACATSATG